jgi:hypothetical protein
MSRALQLTPIALAALLLTACPGNSPVKSPAKIDGGSSAPVYYDGGSYVPPAGDSTVPLPGVDAYVAPPATDLGAAATGTLTCPQIFQCYETCQQTDTACLDGCFFKGTADAQAKADALDQCDYAAETGACKTQCAQWNQTCWTCLDQQCAAQVAACGF